MKQGQNTHMPIASYSETVYTAYSTPCISYNGDLQCEQKMEEASARSGKLATYQNPIGLYISIEIM